MNLVAKLKLENATLGAGLCKSCGHKFEGHTEEGKCLFDAGKLTMHPLEQALAEMTMTGFPPGQLILRSPSGIELVFLVQISAYNSTLTDIRPYVELDLVGYGDFREKDQ